MIPHRTLWSTICGELIPIVVALFVVHPSIRLIKLILIRGVQFVVLITDLIVGEHVEEVNVVSSGELILALVVNITMGFRAARGTGKTDDTMTGNFTTTLTMEIRSSSLDKTTEFGVGNYGIEVRRQKNDALANH